MAAVTGGAAPDFAARVREAQARLAETARRAGLGRDPYAEVIEAQSEALGVLPTFLEALERVRQPWTQDERRAAVRDAVGQMDRRMLRRWAQFNRAGIALGVAAALGFGAACAAGGYWWRGDTAPVAGLVAGRTACADQPGGGTLCQIPVWTRLPPPQGR